MPDALYDDPTTKRRVIEAMAAGLPWNEARQRAAEAIAYLLAIKAEYPPMRHYELATICLVRFGRRPSIKTVKRALATNPLPMLTTRRFPPYHTIPDIVERRRAILRLITEGWTKKSIAGYLGISRKTVHGVLKRWDTEGLAGLKRRSSAPHRHGRRLASTVQHHVRRLQRNPLLGAWRLHAALRREGIHVSPRTCGRLMAINREVFPELRPPEPPPKKDPQPMPFAAQYRHQYWTIDIRYLDMHRLGGGNVYCISILENASRAIVSSAISRLQDTTAVLKVLLSAIETCGCPDGIVSDSGSVFRSRRLGQICHALGIQRFFIAKRQPWQSYIETAFNIQRRMMDEAEAGFRAARTWQELWIAHRMWMQHYNQERHWAHRQRQDGCDTPLSVLGEVHGRIFPEALIRRIFEALRVNRMVDRVGFIRFRHWRIYSELGLARHAITLWIDTDHVMVTYESHDLRRYEGMIARDGTIRHLSHDTKFDHPFASPQLMLWDVIEDDWGKAVPVAHAERTRVPRGTATQLAMDLDTAA